jgi:hypothetical protein
VPKDFKGKPGDILIAIQMGNELGLKPLQSLQNIAIINGRPTMWGDSVIALVRRSKQCEWIKETFCDDTMTATCTVKRLGQDAETRKFSMADAKQARLASKQGPWTQYPKRMLQLRARAFGVRDVFPDLLSGLAITEEIKDYPEQQSRLATAAPLERIPDEPGASATDRLLGKLDPIEVIPEKGPTEPAGKPPASDYDEFNQAKNAIDLANDLGELKDIANPLCKKLAGVDLDIARGLYLDKKRELTTGEQHIE